ncbi:MAG: hypothetical protein ABI878_00105 [Acidobacteriota bacterium]
MKTSSKKILDRRLSAGNLWLSHSEPLGVHPSVSRQFEYNVLESEDTVGKAMFDELATYAAEKQGDIVIVLLGGRGAQAMFRLIADLAGSDEIDSLLNRLHVFTQDALAPMRMNNGLSFVRDFERLLGGDFFRKIKSFTPMITETDDIQGELIEYIETLESLGGIDLFFLGFGPEAEAASHLCYIKPGSGARFNDVAGIIPISPTILEHHISKFKVGGSTISEEDEAECRSATHILTLGPATILRAKRLVQSIVDASTAPAKRESFKRMTATELSNDPDKLQEQTNENPGLLIRLHPDVRSYVLPDLLV